MQVTPPTGVALRHNVNQALVPSISNYIFVASSIK